MANRRTDTEAVINLVINGKQAMTSLGQLMVAQRSLTSEFRHMNELDPQYPKRLRELQAINQAVRQQRALMQGVNDESETLKEHWLEITAGVAAGNLLSGFLESSMSAIQTFIAGSQAAFSESEQGQAQLQAVIKSTGGVAGQTKTHLDEMAQSIMNLTGVDDDVITKSESLLLTFTNIRGEIFDQTLPAIVDMTAALNNGNVSMETIQATTMQVGKALNDPIKGMTALRKVGVSFTEDQVKTVKSMVATNDAAGAQKIILAELAKEFGGVGKSLAETDTGSMQKLQTRLGNIQESLGGLIVQSKASMSQVFAPLVGWLERATETRLSETLDKDRISLAANMIQLQASNTSHETRVGIIKSLKEQYPAYLGQINAEKVSNSNLLPILNEINNALVMRIAFQKKSEDLNHAIQDEADAFLRLDKASTQLSQTMATIMDRAKDKGLNIILPKNLSDLAQADFLVRKLNEAKRDGTGINIKMDVNDIKVAQQNLMQLQRGYSDAGEERAKLLNAQTGFANKYKLNGNGETTKMAQNNAPTVSVPIISSSGANSKELEAEAKKNLAIYKKLDEDYKNLGIQRLEDQLSKNQKEVDQESRKYDDLIERQRNFLNLKKITADQRNTIEAQISQLTAEKDTALSNLRVRQETETNGKIIELRTKLTNAHENELQKEKDLINKFYDGLEKDNIGNQSALDNLKLERTKELSSAELREKKRLEEEKRKIETEFGIQDGTAREQKLAKIKKQYDDEIIALKEKFGKEIQETQAFKDTIDAIEKKRSEANASVDTDTDDDEDKKKKDALIQGAQSVSDAYFSIAANNRQRETDMALRELDRQRQGELANKNLTEKQKEVINAKYDAKVRAEKLKAWQADRNAALSQAIINGALAVVKALPNVFASVAAGIAAAAQIAVIAAQKPPEFGVGVSNFEGGKAIVGEKGPELINENGKLWLADKATLADLPAGTDVYTAEQTASMMKGQSLGEKMYQQVNYSIDTASANKAERNYRSNGLQSYTSTSTGTSGYATSSTGKSDTAALLEKMDSLIEAQKAAQDKKVNFVYADFEKYQEDVIATRNVQSG
ncbi:hypothetical protein DBR40_24665 [Pedobacter sp. KBW01]|uniref:hypothetical protein n=1 Tax=Pedobacter sp. KBW01 TaxID=2153364 RepID=UPI000F5924C4|nr:hypothetical protein [Pedobacter sp. KBW01]RQO65069.1 hypothetical protein DBR40_24665 [Pedobacter sp. KBW01]